MKHLHRLLCAAEEETDPPYMTLKRQRGGHYVRYTASPLSRMFDLFAALPTKTRGRALLQNPFCDGTPLRPGVETMRVLIDEPHCCSEVHSHIRSCVLFPARSAAMEPL